MITIRQIPRRSPGTGTTQKNKKNLLWGVWPPNLTPDPNVPQNFSRAFHGAHDTEKISEIALTVAEKIEFEKKIWRPLAAKPEVIVVM